MRFKPLHSWGLLGLTLLLPIASLAPAQDATGDSPAPRAARWVPAEKALIYAEIADPKALVEVLTSDRLSGLLQAVPGYDKIDENKQLREARAVLQYLADSLDSTPREILGNLLGGHIEILVIGENRLVLVIEPRDVAFLEKAHEKLVTMARQDAEDKGKPDPIKEMDYRGITAYSLSDEEAHAIVDGALVIVSKPELLKGVIDRVQDGVGDEKALADVDLWKQRRAAAKGSSLWSLINLAKLRELDPKRYAPEKIDTGATLLFGTWLEAATKADWAALNMVWNNQKLGLEIAMPPIEGGYPDAMKGFVPGPAEGATPPLKTPSTIASLSLWRDMASIWEARGDLFPPESQQGFAQLDSFAGTFFGGRDFGTGVLGSLGKNWRLVVAKQDPTQIDPRPDVLLPSFALVAEVNDEDPDFAQRLKAAFQSFVGLANLGAAQQKAPPLMLGTEDFDGLTISTARYLPPKERPADEPVHQRFNFSPSAVQVGNHFVLSSSVALAKELTEALKKPAETTEAATNQTFVVVAKGAEVGQLIDQNRERLIADNMLKEGSDRSQAEAQVALMKSLVEYLGDGKLTAGENEQGVRFNLLFELSH